MRANNCRRIRGLQHAVPELCQHAPRPERTGSLAGYRFSRSGRGMTEPTLFSALIAERQATAEKLAQLDAAITLALAQGSNGGPGQVLGVEAAAKRLGCSQDALYRKHHRLRLGYKDALDGKLKFTARELDEYIERRHR